MEGGLESDAKWTEFCRILTSGKASHGTAKIVVAALNQAMDPTPPQMEYRLKP